MAAPCGDMAEYFDFLRVKKIAFSENLKKKNCPIEFYKSLVIYTRVYKLCSNGRVGIFGLSVFEKSPEQVEGRFEWRILWGTCEGVTRSQ